MKKIIFSLLFLFMLAGVATAEDVNFYYANITISNNPGIDDYQTYTVIDYRTGMNSDFSNIRMYDSEGNSIPYWIESYTAGEEATVWYQIDSDTEHVRCYWNLAGEDESESSIGSVMIFGDDFSGDLSKWAVKTNYQIVNGNLKTTSGSARLRASQTFDTENIEIVTKARILTANTGYTRVLVFSNTTAFATGNYTAISQYSTSVWGIRSASTYFTLYPSTPARDTNYHIFTYIRETGNATCYIDNYYAAVTSEFPNSIGYLQAGTDSTGAGHEIDYIFVKKYSSTEPTTVIGGTVTDWDTPETAISNDIFDDLLGYFTSPYVGIVGNYFYVIFGIIPIMMMFLKCQDVTIPTICGLLFTAAFGFSFPETLGVAILMLLATAVGAILFKVFKGVD